MSTTPQSQIPSSRRTIADALQHATRTSFPRQPVGDDVIGAAAVTEQIELAPFLRAQQPTRRWRRASLTGRARLFILVLVAAVAAAPWVWAGMQSGNSSAGVESAPQITSSEGTSIAQPSTLARRVTSSQKAGKLVPGTGTASKPAPPAKLRGRAIHASHDPVVASVSPRRHVVTRVYRQHDQHQNAVHQVEQPIELVPVM